LRRAIDEVLGVTVKFKPQFAEPATAPIKVVAPAAEPEPEPEPKAEVQEEAASEPPVEKAKPKSRNSKMVDEEARYGASLLREMLGAEPIEDKKNTR
jgi:DNA polymerase-3 subunit gamma/tau